MAKKAVHYKVTAYDHAKGHRADISIGTLSKIEAQAFKDTIENMYLISKPDYKILSEIEVEKVLRYTTDGKYTVFAGKVAIAKSFYGEDGCYEVRILQGMPRMETWEKIFNDCPEYAIANDMNINTMPRLFA